MSDRPRCSATNRHGTGCRSFAAADGLCWLHNPKNAEARRRACAEGGRRSTALRAIRGSYARLDTSAGLVKFIATLAQDVLQGRVEPDVGRVVGYLISIQRQCIESGDLAARLEALEALQATGPGRGRWA